MSEKLLWIFVPAVLVVFGAYWVIRRRQRLPDVSEGWLRDKAYDRTGS